MNDGIDYPPARPIRTIIELAMEHNNGSQPEARRWLNENVEKLLEPNEAIASVQQRWLEEIIGRIHDWCIRKWGDGVEEFALDEMCEEV